MKSTFFSGLVCASLLVFAIGCGKDKKDGGGGALNPYSYNPGVLAPGVVNNSHALTYLEELRSWANNNLNRTDPQFFLGQGLGFSKATFTPSTSNQNSNCTTFLGMKFCGSVSWGSGGIQPDAGSIAATCISRQANAVLVASAQDLNSCYSISTTNGVNYTNESNPDLAQALSLNNGAWVIYDIQKQGAMYSLALGPNTFDVSASIFVQIDTAIHPVYNPVRREEVISNSRKIKSIYYYY